MKLFNLTFKNDIPGTGGLFFRGENCEVTGNAVRVRAGGTADFGAYFNLFPYCLYRKYCGTECVSLHLYGEGRYTVSICLKTRENCTSVLKKLPADGDITAEIGVSTLPDGGYLYFTIATENGCKIYGGAWHSREEARRNVKFGIVICTYKREQFVKANLACITEAIENDPVWADRLHVFVVDNAGTLDLQNTPYYAVINNKNLGGSGGFTRGMCAVYDSGEYTHMLLMDDDISFDFETIKRTWCLASCLTEEHIRATIGGTMLILEEPCVQQELGGMFDGLRVSQNNGKLDVSLTENLLKNANAQKADYQGWWFCCMPVSYVKDYGLPMPYFIKIDDVEYSLRCCKELIIDNGIAVWHGGFESKASYTLEYYIKRNESVTCAIRYKHSGLWVALKFLYSTHAQLLQKDYGYAETLLHGYSDFIKGSKFFEETDPEKLNAEVMTSKPDTLTYAQIEDICGINPENIEEKKPHRSNIFKKIVLFTENYTPSFALKNEVGATQICYPVPSRAYRKKTVVKYNPITKTGYVCTFDKKRRKELRRQITKMFFKLLFGYRKIRKDYAENAQKLCSRENWDRLFGGKN